MNKFGGFSNQNSLIFSSDRQEFLRQAETFLDQERFAEVIDLAGKRLAVHPDDVDARLIQGAALCKLGREKESLAVFKAVREDLLNWAKVFEYLGDIFQNRGEIEKARDCFQTLVHLCSDPQETERLLKKIYALGGMEIEAGEDLFGPLSGGFKTLTMADLYIRQGHLEMAADVLREILRAEPENRKAADRLGEVEALLNGKNFRPERAPGAVVDELNRWLKHLKKLKRNDA